MFLQGFRGLSDDPFFRSVLSETPQLRQLQREVNRLFDGRFGDTGEDSPQVSLWVSPTEALLVVELPGVDPQKVELTVLAKALSLKGEWGPEAVRSEGRLHRCERAKGAFTRTIQLPYDVQADKVQAEYKNGLLKVSLPRAGADRPKKITIR